MINTKDLNSNPNSFTNFKVMSKKKLALDAQSHLELLVRLFNIEEILENGMYGEVSKELTSLIEDVRYSEIIESYEIMKDE